MKRLSSSSSPLVFLAFALLAGCNGDDDSAATRETATAPATPAEKKAEKDADPSRTDAGSGAEEDASAPPCPWTDDAGKCHTPAPSNGAALGGLPSTGAAIVIAQTTSFDTDADCKAASVLGDCSVAFQSDGPAVCVCRAGSFDLASVMVTGPRSLALFAASHVVVRGTLDVSAWRGANGPGAQVGAAFVPSNASITPLRGGVAGASTDANLARGGGGGGAVQISAGIDIAVTPAGVVQAGGGGGGAWARSGAAGGDGGAILLEAPAVRIEGKLLANGGGGGGGGNGTTAGDKGVDAFTAGSTVANGGASREGDGCTAFGDTEGGEGGDGATRDHAAGTGGAYDSVGCIPTREVFAGGRGGATGRIRLNTQSGAGLVTSSSAHASPAPSTGAMTIAP